METAYLLFTLQDPIARLKSMSENLPMEKKVTFAPHIRRAEATMRGCRTFRTVLLDEENALVAELFKIYFENAITKGKLTIIPKSAGGDFLRFFEKVTEPMKLGKIQSSYYNKLIRKLSREINEFVASFVYLKTAEAEYRHLA